MLPSDFFPFNVTIDSTGLPGGLFLSNIVFDKSIPNSSYLMILSELGDPLYYKEVPTGGFDFKRQEGGEYTYYLTADIGFVCMDSTFKQISEYKTGNGYITDVHDFRLLPNGHALLLATDPEPVDMSAVVPGGAPNALVTGNVIQEIDHRGNVVFQWRSWDHFKTGVYSYRAIVAPWLPPAGYANKGNPVPQGFSLHPNYPNPFNPSTTIEYEVPTAAGPTRKPREQRRGFLKTMAEALRIQQHSAITGGMGSKPGLQAGFG